MLGIQLAHVQAGGAGCNPRWRRLQPYVTQGLTPCVQARTAEKLQALKAVTAQLAVLQAHHHHQHHHHHLLQHHQPHW